MMTSLRSVLSVLTLVGAMGLAAPSAAAPDFPAGTVSASVTGVSGTCTNILSTGPISGASAVYSGGNLVIALPGGGPLSGPSTLTVVNISTSGSKSGTSTNLSNDPLPSGTSTADILLDASSTPTAFSVSTDGPLTNPSSRSTCSADFVVSGSVSSSSASNANPNAGRSSAEIMQRQIALSHTTSGPFVDTTKAVDLGLRKLAGSGGPRPFSVDRGGASFSTRGLAAGEWTLPVGLWGSVGYTSSDDDFYATAADSERWHGTLGLDASVTDWLIVGLAGGYEREDADTTFNDGNMNSDGYTVVAYLGALLTRRLSVDFSLGRSFLSTDQYRTCPPVPTTPCTTGARVTSSLDGDRFFAAGNANYGASFGDWRLTARAGLLWLRDQQDAFTESDGTAVGESSFRVGRAKFGGELARAFGSFEPYASATYNYSFQQSRVDFASDGQDRADVLLGIGARYFASEALSGSFEVNTLLGRRNVDEYSVNFLLRADF